MRRFFLIVLLGALAGLTAMAADQILSELTSGYFAPLRSFHLVIYLGLGVLAAGLVHLACRLRRAGGSLPLVSVYSYALVIIYAFPLFVRAEDWVYHRGWSIPVRLAGGAIALGGYAAWIWFLTRVVSPGRKWPGAFAGALTAAAGLALNQNVFYSPLAPAALASDALVLLVAVGIAALERANRRVRLVAATSVGLVAIAWIATIVDLGTPSAVDRSRHDHPNLILVIIDTLRADVFETVLEETEEGREFRRSLGGATWFNRAMAASPWTPPSMASLMTGLYPPEHGHETRKVVGAKKPVLMELSQSVPTLAEQLRDRGYWTEALVTNPHIQRTGGLARGYERYEYVGDAAIQLPVLWAFSSKGVGLFASHAYEDARVLRRRVEARSTELGRLDQPFHLWLHAMDPHEPLAAHLDLSPDPVNPPLTEMQRLYRDEVRFCLRELGRTIEDLRERGLLSNTVVVLVADHGEMLPADGHDTGTLQDDGTPKLYGHGHAFYEEVVRIPFVIKVPDAAAGDRVVDTLVSHVDLYDTLAALLGIEFEPLPPGRFSLATRVVPGIDAVPSASRTFTVMSANVNGPQQLALRTDKFKLIVYPEGERGDEFYDLTSDPLEQSNLADTQPERVAELKSIMELARSAMVEADSQSPSEMSPETLERLKALGYVH